MLIAVEQSGITKHSTLTFGHYVADLTIFWEDCPESLDKVEDLLQPLIPDGMNAFREYTSDREVEYLTYCIAFD